MGISPRDTALWVQQWDVGSRPAYWRGLQFESDKT